MATASQEAKRESYRQKPIFWYAALETALENGDIETAAQAVRALRRLGIDVQYRRLAPQHREAINEG